MRRKLLLLLFALPLLATAAEPPDPHIAHVENGLLPPILIAGRPIEPWSITARMAHYHVPAVSIAVIDHGAIAWARAYGVRENGQPGIATPDTLFQAASISKPVTAAAALTLVESGRLPLDTDVNQLLKSWQVPAAAVAAGEPVTLRRLLSHTAGVTIHGFDGYAAGTPLPTLPQILDGVAPANSSPIRVALKPGTTWRYSGGGYCIVQQLLLDVTDEEFPKLLHERVLTPAGMTASTFEQPLPAPLATSAASGHDKDGRPVLGHAHVYPEMAAAGLWTTAPDLARFALALAHSLTGEPGPTLFSRTTAETMIAVQLAGSDYGLGIGVKGSGDALQVEHNGANAGFRSLLVSFPRTGRGAVILTNGDNGGAVANELIRAVAREYGWPDYQPAERKTIPLTTEALDTFAGRYEREDTVLRFVHKDDRLYLRMTGEPTAEVFAQSDHEFFLIYRPDTFTFETDDSGRVTHVIRRVGGNTEVFPRVD